MWVHKFTFYTKAEKKKQENKKYVFTVLTAPKGVIKNKFTLRKKTDKKMAY